jgi:hypothetical protein
MLQKAEDVNVNEKSKIEEVKREVLSSTLHVAYSSLEPRVS